MRFPYQMMGQNISLSQEKMEDPQVEHLLPHKNGKYKDRKFDWENLFWACGHCNGIKNQNKYDEGILNCCKRDPEKLIDFQLNDDNIKLTRYSTVQDADRDESSV